MAERSSEAALQDIVDAAARIDMKLRGIVLEQFQGDMDRRQIVERNFEIISEASRRVSDEIKERHQHIPWPKVAGIGNILRHDYENIVPDTLWKVAHDDLPALDRACQAELMREKLRQNDDRLNDTGGRSR